MKMKKKEYLENDEVEWNSMIVTGTTTTATWHRDVEDCVYEGT